MKVKFILALVLALVCLLAVDATRVSGTRSRLRAAIRGEDGMCLCCLLGVVNVVRKGWGAEKREAFSVFKKMSPV